MLSSSTSEKKEYKLSIIKLKLHSYDQNHEPYEEKPLI
jgi:hypothetical protein